MALSHTFVLNLKRERADGVVTKLQQYIINYPSRK